MALHFLNDVFLLHFALEATQCIFEGLSLLDSDFCQLNDTPKPVLWDCLVMSRFRL